jgi:hypothetical protein
MSASLQGLTPPRVNLHLARGLDAPPRVSLCLARGTKTPERVSASPEAALDTVPVPPTGALNAMACHGRPSQG